MFNSDSIECSTVLFRKVGLLVTGQRKCVCVLCRRVAELGLQFGLCAPGWGRWASCLAGGPFPLPLADGVGVADDHLVHPGEGLGEEHGTLEEAQVTPVERQGKHHIGLFFCGGHTEREQKVLFK